MTQKKPSFLIDINGVLYTDGKPIKGASEAVDFLRDNDHAFRFVSNATQSCRKTIHKKLLSFGFDIKEKEIVNAPTATALYLKAAGKKKCFLLTKGDVHKDFSKHGIKNTRKDPDYVVVGDAGEKFTYENMNTAFKLLLSGAGLIAMEKDRYWMSEKGLALCAGPYVSALEYAAGKKAILTGKPSKEFLKMALMDMGAAASETISIGDDPVTDVYGAQRLGMKGWLVRTGKYKGGKLKHVKPDKVLGSIAELINIPAAV
jgi:HAD superfamily hydrolase (TIGR01458 family)